jgi:DNA processing protein
LKSAGSAHFKQLGLKPAAIAWLRNPDNSQIESDLRWLEQPGHHLVTWDDERYPALLRKIASPPAALFVDGDPDILWQPQLAVIGSRNPTSSGSDHARDFTQELCRNGLAITSGLASGIDTVAHQAALEAGGSTIAVNGTGLDTVYPASSEAVAERIRAEGAMVSEFPLDFPARKKHFPSRNRIISGLSLGVFVVEAALRSGTLITARLAAEQGREVFALPGSIHNPLAKGCHRLIRDGARLVETAADILQDIAPMAQELAQQIRSQLDTVAAPELEKKPANPKIGDDPDYIKLWSGLSFDPIPVNRLVESTGLTVQSISSMLLMLELRGMVEAHPGGAYSRK